MLFAGTKRTNSKGFIFDGFRNVRLIDLLNLFCCNTHYITVLSYNDGKPCGRSNVYSDFVEFYLCDVFNCWVGKGADGPELFVVIKEPF